MENKLRTIHVMEDGTVRMHCPDPGSRRVTVVVNLETGEIFRSDVPVPLYSVLGAYDPVKLANWDIIAGETDEEHLARTSAVSAACIQREKTGPRLKEVSRLNVRAVDLPTRGGKKMFRSAWRAVGDQVIVEPQLARAELMSEVRRMRNERLKEQDGDSRRIDDEGTPAQKQEMAKYRKALRDLPATVEKDIAALDVDQLWEFKPNFPEKPNLPAPARKVDD